MATKKSDDPIIIDSKEEKTTRTSKLYRSETNKVLGGVCGGLGNYFNIDPTIIRIVFIAITLLGGSGVLVYIILWLVIPSQSSSKSFPEDHIKENAQEMKSRGEKFASDIRNSVNNRDQNSRSWWALFIVVIGFMFLLSNYGYYSFIEMEKLWPVILIVFGLILLLRK